MRYIDIGGVVVPKHCKYGPRPAEGIVFNNIEWWSITDHLVKEQREREYAAVQRAKEEAKKEISYNMTRNWTNTLASVKTQGDQKRLEKMKKEKQDKIDQYNEIMKNRLEEKKQLLANVKKILFEQEDATKTIASAVGLSLVGIVAKRYIDRTKPILWRTFEEVLFMFTSSRVFEALEECNNQVEWKRERQKEEKRKEMEMALEYKKQAEEFEREKLCDILKEREKKAIQRKYLDEQMAGIKKKRQEEEEELAREKQDLINMRIEEEKIHHCNMVEKNYRKEFAARYMKKSEAQLEFERKLILEQEEEDEINKIFMEYDRKFKKDRKEREERIKNEAVERRIKVAEKLAEKLREAARKEEERLQAAAEEKEREALRDEASKRELQELALKSLLDGKRKSEQRKAKLQYERKEEKKWELMQQYRSAEINDEWRAEHRRRVEEMKRQVRAGYDCQIKQMKERQQKEQEELLKSLEYEKEDNQDFLQYCKETMEFIKENNLPEYPVLATIWNLKKKYGILDEKESRQKQQSEQQGGRKGNPRSSINGCFCFKY